MFRKTTALERRRRKLERELAILESDIRSLSKVANDPVKAERVKLKHHEANAPARSRSKTSAKKERSSTHSTPKEHEERFAEYLSGNFQTVGSLKNERKLQRNKAIVMVVVVIVVLLWLWRHLF